MDAPLRRHALGWLVLPALAVANGFVRDTTYGHVMSDDVAHSISVLPLVVLIALWAGFLAQRWPLRSAREATAIGGLWLALTVVFELGLGLLQGMPLSR